MRPTTFCILAAFILGSAAIPAAEPPPKAVPPRIVSMGMVKSETGDFLSYQSLGEELDLRWWPNEGKADHFQLKGMYSYIQGFVFKNRNQVWLTTKLGRLADAAELIDLDAHSVLERRVASGFHVSPKGEFVAIDDSERVLYKNGFWTSDWTGIDDVFVYPKPSGSHRENEEPLWIHPDEPTDKKHVFEIRGSTWTADRRLEFAAAEGTVEITKDQSEVDHYADWFHITVDVKSGESHPIKNIGQLETKKERITEGECKELADRLNEIEIAKKKDRIVMSFDTTAALRSFEFINAHPPQPFSHTSTIAEVAPGEFLAAWVSGPAPRTNGVNVWMSRRVGGAWEAPVETIKIDAAPCFNPVLIPHPQTGELLLSYKIGPSPSGWTGILRRSRDAGRTWSEPETLPAGLVGPVRSKPLILDDGTMICGDSVEAYEAWAGWVNVTHDAGKTWTRHGPITIPGQPHGVIQPVIFWGDSAKKTLRALLRPTEKVGVVCESTSSDMGLTWTPARPMPGMPNPNSALDVTELPDGRLAMAHNDQVGAKTRLSLSLSADRGLTWKRAIIIYEEPEGEYSYPAMILGSDGLLRITFSWKREKIGYIEVDPAALPE